jgi:hypothetical protein
VLNYNAFVLDDRKLLEAMVGLQLPDNLVDLGRLVLYAGGGSLKNNKPQENTSGSMSTVIR